MYHTFLAIFSDAGQLRLSQFFTYISISVMNTFLHKSCRILGHFLRVETGIKFLVHPLSPPNELSPLSPSQSASLKSCPYALAPPLI